MVYTGGQDLYTRIGAGMGRGGEDDVVWGRINMYVASVFKSRSPVFIGRLSYVWVRDDGSGEAKKRRRIRQ